MNSVYAPGDNDALAFLRGVYIDDDVDLRHRLTAAKMVQSHRPQESLGLLVAALVDAAAHEKGFSVVR